MGRRKDCELKFEDLNTYSGTAFYAATNENPDMFREMIKGRRISRAVGICSGGEICFSCILPTTKDEVVLVDHSYGSMSTAMLKFLTLREKGPKETIRLLSQGGNAEVADELRELWEALAKELPPKIRDEYGRRRDGYIFNHVDTHEYYYDSYGYRRSRRTDASGKPKWRLCGSIIKYWSAFKPDLIAQSYRKLDKIRFVHGDMHDMVELGPFDLFYVSNAFEHHGRFGAPSHEIIQKALKPGGLIVGAQAHRAPDTWKELDSRRGAWTYKLYKIEQPAAAAAAA